MLFIVRLEHSRMKCRRVSSFLAHNYLSVTFVISVVFGVCVGEILKNIKTYTDREVMYVGFPGEIFMRILTGISLPLLSACIIVTFAVLDTRMAKLYGTKLAIFVIMTKLISLIIGMTIGIIFKPGIFGEEHIMRPPEDYYSITTESVDFIFDILNNLVPSNFVEMIFTSRVTNVSRSEKGQLVVEEVIESTANATAITTFSILAGLVLKGLQHYKYPILELVVAAGNICFAIVKMVLYVSPLAIISMVAQEVIRHDGFNYVMYRVNYMLCLFGGLMINVLVIYPLLIFFIGRENPLKVYWHFLGAITTGFVTSSSVTSFPVMMKILKRKMGYDRDLLKFVVPICVALNKDGDVIALALSSVFLAQHVQGYVELRQYVAIALLSVFVTVATPEVAEGSIMSLITILQAIGVPAEHVGTLMALGLLLDRMITSVNVISCAVAVSTLSRRTAAERLERAQIVSSLAESIPEVPILKSSF